MMNLKQQQEAATALGNMLRVGYPLAESGKRMARLQPELAEFWLAAAERLGSGKPLSLVVESQWPKAAIAALRAGEASGKLPEVLAELVDTIKMQRSLIATAMKMQYPLHIAAAASTMFVVILLTVVPTVAQQMHSQGAGGELGGVAGFGLMVRTFLIDYWVVSVVGLAGAAAIITTWARAESTKQELVRLLLGMPILGKALHELWFGLWAKYMALSINAGIPTIESLQTTLDVLPPPLRPGVEALIEDLNVRHISMDVAADPREQTAGDPRRKWPFYITLGFISGHTTGELDRELALQSPNLIQDGTDGIERALRVSNRIAMAFAALLVGSAFLLIYAPMLQNMAKLR